MPENDTEVINSKNDTETTANEETTDDVVLEEETDDVEELKKELKTAKAQKEHWKNKALNGTSKEEVKSAEKAPVKTDSDLSTTDLFALISAKVPEQHVKEVVKAAKLLNLTVPEALRDPLVQARLKQLADFEATALATNKKTSKPSTKQVDDDEILKRASKGEIPEKGSEEADRLFWARRGKKKS